MRKQLLHEPGRNQDLPSAQNNGRKKDVLKTHRDHYWYLKNGSSLLTAKQLQIHSIQKLFKYREKAKTS